MTSSMWPVFSRGFFGGGEGVQLTPSDTSTTTDAVVKTIAKVLADISTTTDTATIDLDRANSDTSNTTDAVVKTVGKVIADTSSTTDAATITGGQRYGVQAGSWTWNGTVGTKWAYFSGHTAGAPVPTASTPVFFDANSGSGTITLTGSQARSIDALGFVGTISVPNTNNILLGDSVAPPNGIALRFTSSMTLTMGGTGAQFTLRSTNASTHDIYSGTKLYALTINGPGATFRHMDAWGAHTNTSLTITAGSYYTNNQSINAVQLSSSNSNVREIHLGSSTVALTSASAPVSLATQTNLTWDAGTSLVRVIGTGSTGFAGAGLTWYDVEISGANASTTHAITGANTFHNLTLSNPANTGQVFTISADQIVTNLWSANGESAVNKLTIKTNVNGTQRKISAGSVSLSNFDVQDIDADGAAIPFGGTSLVDLGNNIDWQFVDTLTLTPSDTSPTTDALVKAITKYLADTSTTTDFMFMGTPTYDSFDSPLVSAPVGPTRTRRSIASYSRPVGPTKTRRRSE